MLGRKGVRAPSPFNTLFRVPREDIAVFKRLYLKLLVRIFFASLQLCIRSYKGPSRGLARPGSDS